jgi:hypothetical protein
LLRALPPLLPEAPRETSSSLALQIRVRGREGGEGFIEGNITLQHAAHQRMTLSRMEEVASGREQASRISEKGTGRVSCDVEDVPVIACVNACRRCRWGAGL